MLARPARPRTTPRRPLSQGPTWVYLIEGFQTEILYVGVTAHLSERLAAHRRDKPWWHSAYLVDASLYETRQIALAWEAVMIASGTAYNVQVPLCRPLPADWNPNTSALNMAQLIVGEDC